MCVVARVIVAIQRSRHEDHQVQGQDELTETLRKVGCQYSSGDGGATVIA